VTDPPAPAAFGLPVLEYLAAHDDRPCFYFEEATISYRDVRGSIYRVARALGARGLRRGDGIAVLAGNRPELFYLRTAAQLLGVRATVLHTLSSVHDHAFIVEDAELGGIVFDPFYEDTVAELGTRVPLGMIASLGPAGSVSTCWTRLPARSRAPCGPSWPFASRDCLHGWNDGTAQGHRHVAGCSGVRGGSDDGVLAVARRGTHARFDAAQPRRRDGSRADVGSRRFDRATRRFRS